MKKENYVTEKPGLFLKDDAMYGGCYGTLGANPIWNNYINLGEGCDTFGVAAHALVLGIGMFHEHSRPDHDRYVRILWQNIRDHEKVQFDMVTDADTTQPYYIRSLLHYGENVLGKDVDRKRLKTIEKVAPSTRTMGNRMGLSQVDARQVTHMYGCTVPAYFTLCAVSKGCAKHDCACHQSGTSTIIKVTSSDNRTLTRMACGCADEYTKGRWTDYRRTFTFIVQLSFRCLHQIG